jgi:regulator of replication initiation timing
MKNQLQEDIAEAEPYLEKSSGRKTRREKSAKARQKRSNRESKLEREYEEGFHGNYEN